MNTSGAGTQLFRLAESGRVLSTGDEGAQVRFAREVKYCEYYAAQFSECLGLQGLKIGVVEDCVSQVAFAYAPSALGARSLVNGFVTERFRSLGQAVNEITSED